MSLKKKNGYVSVWEGLDPCKGIALGGRKRDLYFAGGEASSMGERRLSLSSPVGRWRERGKKKKSMKKRKRRGRRRLPRGRAAFDGRNAKEKGGGGKKGQHLLSSQEDKKRNSIYRPRRKTCLALARRCDPSRFGKKGERRGGETMVVTPDTGEEKKEELYALRSKRVGARQLGRKEVVTDALSSR